MKLTFYSMSSIHQIHSSMKGKANHFLISKMSFELRVREALHLDAQFQSAGIGLELDVVKFIALFIHCFFTGRKCS